MLPNLRAFSIEPMRRADLPEVMLVDRQSFPCPWLEDAYITELGNRSAQYFVARSSGAIVGYAGIWVVNREAHVTTLGVHPDSRRRGVGERLIIAVLNEAIARRADRVSLEVRVSNSAARSLYARYGFVEAERRAAYYTDNGEDALTLRVSDLQTPAFAGMLDQRSRQLARRI